jgi:hypothetical protein
MEKVHYAILYLMLLLNKLDRLIIIIMLWTNSSNLIWMQAIILKLETILNQKHYFQNLLLIL